MSFGPVTSKDLQTPLPSPIWPLLRGREEGSVDPSLGNILSFYYINVETIDKFRYRKKKSNWKIYKSS